MDVGAIDLLDGDFYVDDPYAAYRWMRANAPLYWDAVNELWGVSRYDDIVDVERRKDVFVNSDQAKGGYRPNIPADRPSSASTTPPPQASQPGVAPVHPPAVAAREDHVRTAVRGLIDAVAANGHRRDRRRAGGAAAAMTIAWLLGFPEERWPS